MGTLSSTRLLNEGSFPTQAVVGVSVYCRVIRGDVFRCLRAVKLLYLKAKLAASENRGKKKATRAPQWNLIISPVKAKKKEKEKEERNCGCLSEPTIIFIKGR